MVKNTNMNDLNYLKSFRNVTKKLCVLLLFLVIICIVKDVNDVISIFLAVSMWLISAVDGFASGMISEKEEQ